MAIRLYYKTIIRTIRSRRIWLIADSVLRTSSAISSYTIRAHGIIVKYSRTPLTRTPKGNEKLFELAGVRINRSWCQISFTMLIMGVR